MAKMKCEICGSEEIVKENELFVCKGCGCQYTLEQARKLVGTQPSAEQGKPNALDNLYILARRARENKDYKKVEEYYLQILEENPNDWEATFYSELACARRETEKESLPNIFFRRMSKIRALVYGLIKKTFPEKRTQSEKLKEVISELLLFKEIYYDRVQLVHRHLNSLSMHIGTMMWEYGDNIVNTFGEDEEFKEPTVEAWKCGVQVVSSFVNYIHENPHGYTFGNTDRNTALKNYTDTIQQYVNKISQKDHTYNPPYVKAVKKGCYVATCVYGSYDCPEVWTLRRYRDNTLAASRMGRAFIRLYYAVSPTVVKLFGKTKWFRNMWKRILDKKIKKLQAQGVECVPYQDKEW